MASKRALKKAWKKIEDNGWIVYDVEGEPPRLSQLGAETLIDYGNRVLERLWRDSHG